MISIDSFIEIYATNRVDFVEKNGQLLTAKFNMTEQELTSNIDYSVKKEKVKALKLALEEALNSSNPPDRNDGHDEVRKCLQLTKNLCLFEKGEAEKQAKLNILNGLIINGLYKSWARVDQDHFKAKFSKLRDYHMFFVSYTNEGAHILNGDFKSLIEKLIKKLDGTPLVPNDFTEDNLVAEKSVVDFTKRGVPLEKIFYDKRKITTGDHLKNTILPNCINSFAFVQILHEDTFTETWPYEEFKAYKDTTDPFFCFLVCADDLNSIKPEFFPDNYNAWFTTIEAIRYETVKNDHNNFKDIIKKVSGAINRRINCELFNVV